MKLPHCDREQEVVDALRSGRWASAWGGELRQHAAACAVCAEVAIVTSELQHELEAAQADIGLEGRRLPSAGLVWWKAQLAARRAAEQRATAPIAWTERAALALGAFALVLLGAWQWPQITAWLQGETSAHSTRLLALPNLSDLAEWARRLAASWTSQTPALLLAVSAVACLTLLALAAYVVWQED